MKPPPARQRAFTRVELLFSGVAVAVLFTLLLMLALRKEPRSSSDPLAAQRALCLDNLRQLATAELMYAADYQGRFCPSYLDYASLEFKNVWMGALADYHGRPDGVWLCPAATNPPMTGFRGSADRAWAYPDPVSDTETPGSYAINGYLGLGKNHAQAREANFKPKNVFHQQATLRRAQLTPLFCDAMYWNCGLEETDAPSRNFYEPQGNAVTPGSFRKVLTQFIARHGDAPASEAPRDWESETLPGAINVTFADGHAETVALENLWTLYWHKNWNPARVPSPHQPPK